MVSHVIHYPLEPWLDLTDALGDSVFYSLSIGYDGGLFGLLIDPPYEIRREGSFRIKPVGRQISLNYSVLQIYDWGIQRTKIDGQGLEYSYAQLLPGNDFLVVAARARDNGRLVNGHMFAQDGTFIRGFNLGDAIEDVQVTAEGHIWTGYWDEAFGNENYGLMKWGPDGERLYHCRNRDVFDCYALNATGQGESWFYYYTDFHLVHLKDDHEVNYWEVPVAGSDRFAIWRHLALFDGGYNHHGEYYVLLEMKDNHQMAELARFIFVDAEDDGIHPQAIAMRGSLIVLIAGNKLYRVYVYQLRDR